MKNNTPDSKTPSVKLDMSLETFTEIYETMGAEHLYAELQRQLDIRFKAENDTQQKVRSEKARQVRWREIKDGINLVCQYFIGSLIVIFIIWVIHSSVIYCDVGNAATQAKEMAICKSGDTLGCQIALDNEAPAGAEKPAFALELKRAYTIKTNRPIYGTKGQ